jgi:hypothetical protein
MAMMKIWATNDLKNLRFVEDPGALQKSVWEMLETAHAIAKANPQSELGQFLTAMDAWRYKLSTGDKEAFDLMNAVEPTMPWDKSVHGKRKRKLPVKGFIPTALFKMMQDYIPGFHRNETFLDEFFTKHPLGMRLANPCWIPKLPSERIDRGVSSYAKSVTVSRKEGYIPLLQDLRRPRLLGGERTLGT